MKIPRDRPNPFRKKMNKFKNEKTITINIGGVPYKVCKLGERDNNDIEILPSFARTTRDAGRLNNLNEILDRHYTVHCSKESLYNRNLIKQTTVYKNGKSKDSEVQLTKAIKEFNRFAVVFTKRFQDLNKEKYKAKPTTSIDEISIGEYNPETCTLYLMLCVSAASESCDQLKDKNINSLTIPLEVFAISIFWNFVKFPSLDNNTIRLYTTRPPEEFAQFDVIDQHANGFEKNELPGVFLTDMNDLHEEFITLWLQQGMTPEQIQSFPKGLHKTCTTSR